MRITKLISTGLAAALAAGALTVVAATSASAVDDGPTLPGNIYTLDSKTGIAGSYYEDEVLSGTFAHSWNTIAATATCPAGTTSTAAWVRLPQGSDQAQWTEAQLTANEPYTTDSKGVYLTTDTDTMDNGTIQAFLAGSTKDLPLALICFEPNPTGGGPQPIGHFETTVTVSPTDANGNGTWSIKTPPPALPHKPGGATATTTTLTGVGAGSNFLLTASVVPAAATGTVTFTEGGTTVGTATVSGGAATVTIANPSVGLHTYKASFAPSDTSTYQASTVQASFTVTKAANGSVTVTLTVPGQNTTEPGTVTLSVPSSATVALSGTRSSDNSRVTATATLPTVTVTDTHRSDLLTAWQVSVQAADFSGAGGTVGAKYLGWTPATPTITKDQSSQLDVTAGAQVASFLDDSTSAGLSTAQPLATVSTKGDGTVALGGALNLSIPGSTAQGTYTSVLTVTLVNG